MLQLLICSDFCTRYPDEHITVLNVASGGVARLLDYLIRMFWMWWQMEPWHRAGERGDGYSLAPRLTTNTSTRYKIFLKILTIMLICSYVRGHTRQGGRKHTWDVMVSTTSRPVFFLRRLSRCRASAVQWLRLQLEAKEVTPDYWDVSVLLLSNQIVSIEDNVKPTIHIYKMDRPELSPL